METETILDADADCRPKRQDAMASRRCDAAQLLARREVLLTERRASTFALSARLFNHPGVHDAYRGTRDFERLQVCNAALREIDGQLRALGRPSWVETELGARTGDRC